MAYEGSRKDFALTPSDEGLLACLKICSPHQYQVLTAINQDGKFKSYKELANEFGWPVNTVRTRLHRARAKILAWRASEVQSD